MFRPAKPSYSQQELQIIQNNDDGLYHDGDIIVVRRNGVKVGFIRRKHIFGVYRYWNGYIFIPNNLKLDDYDDYNEIFHTMGWKWNDYPIPEMTYISATILGWDHSPFKVDASEYVTKEMVVWEVLFVEKLLQSLVNK